VKGNAPIYREDLDRSVCEGCGKRPEDHTFQVNPVCHDDAGVVAEYRVGEGTLRLYCKVCNDLVMVLQVARRSIVGTN